MPESPAWAKGLPASISERTSVLIGLKTQVQVEILERESKMALTYDRLKTVCRVRTEGTQAILRKLSGFRVILRGFTRRLLSSCCGSDEA